MIRFSLFECQFPNPEVPPKKAVLTLPYYWLYFVNKIPHVSRIIPTYDLCSKIPA